MRLSEYKLAIRTLNKSTTSRDMADKIASDPCRSYWLKAAIKAAGERDCLDMLNDAKALMDYCMVLCEEQRIGYTPR